MMLQLFIKSKLSTIDKFTDKVETQGELIF